MSFRFQRVKQEVVLFCKRSNLHMWNCGLEDVQHAVTCLVPGHCGELLSVQNDHILQTVGAGAGKLLIV